MTMCYFWSNPTLTLSLFCDDDNDVCVLHGCVCIVATFISHSYESLHKPYYEKLTCLTIANCTCTCNYVLNLQLIEKQRTDWLLAIDLFHWILIPINKSVPIDCIWFQLTNDHFLSFSHTTLSTTQTTVPSKKGLSKGITEMISDEWGEFWC